MRTASRTVNARRGAESDVSPDSSSSLAPAVTRAAAILDVLAESPAAPTPLSDLARRLGLPKSSVANITGALVEAGLVRRVDSGFRLGRRLAELGGAYLATVDHVQQFAELARALPIASEETMQMAILDGLDVTYVARHDGRQPIRLASDVGRRLPASCTALGKAALASLDPAELAARLRGVRGLPALTPNSHRRVADLLADLEGVRRRGYAVDNEETAEGIVCFGVAIPRRAGDVPHALSVTLLKARADDARRDALLVDLTRLARQLSHPLISPNGERVPSPP
jgi:DNA-binding IclR family transcriptional regulator